MSDHLVLTDLADGVLLVRMNRPEAMNALSVGLARELTRTWERATADDEVRAVVLTGEGRGFCAGADLREQRSGDSATEGLQVTYHPAITGLVAIEKPVLAAVNGPVAGAGLALALAADARIASPSAKFVPAFASIGLIPDSGVGYLAARVLGDARALRWLTSGAPLSAQEAADAGAVESVSEDAVAVAVDIARGLAETPGRAYGLTKRIMWAEGRRRLAEYLAAEVELQQLAVTDPERGRARARLVAKLGSAESTGKEA